MQAKAVLKLEGPMDHLRLVWQAGEALLEHVKFEEDCEGTRYNVLVAVQEMLTNVLRHGYEAEDDGPVEVEFRVAADEFCVELRDRSDEFNPLGFEPSVGTADESLPPQPGGYGIHIARMVMDFVDYERRDGWNCLRLVKGAGVRAGI